MMAQLQRDIVMHVDGECHCGRIAYEAAVDPRLSAICNCTDCQQFSGSPWRASVPAKAEDFRLLRCALKTYVKTAQRHQTASGVLRRLRLRRLFDHAGEPDDLQPASRRVEAARRPAAEAADLDGVRAPLGARHHERPRRAERLRASDNLVGNHLEGREVRRTETRGDRDIGGIPAASDQDTPNARAIVARVERVPAAT